MFSNFFKIAYRVFLRERVHTLICIFGLAIGLAFSIIIFLYAHKELSYDRFHNHANRIYRVAVDRKIGGNVHHHAITAPPLAKALTREIPEIESSLRIAHFEATLIRYKNIKYYEDQLIYADSNFFTFFSFPLVEGNTDQVLSKPYSIVLSRQAAKRYFGSENPLGKKLQFENDTIFFKVTGIMEDVPENSHVHFDMVGNLSSLKEVSLDKRWYVHYLYTYFTAREGASPEKIESGFERIVSNHVIPDYRKFIGLKPSHVLPPGYTYHLTMMPLTSIHLKSDYTHEMEPAGKILNIYLFTVLAIIILILSCLNFISLVTAVSINRAKEVGIRKLAGSERPVLMRQFIFESFLLASLAMTLALLFVELSLPAFSKFIGLHLRLGQLMNSSGILVVVLLIVFMGLLSGLYPAWQISSFNPVTVLRNRLDKKGSKGYFRKAIALFQLFLAIGTITMTMIIAAQHRYLINKDRGYETKNLVVIRRPDGLGKNLEDYKKEILQSPDVLSVTNTENVMGGHFSKSPFYPEGSSSARNYSLSYLFISHDFDSTYRTKMASGRFFSKAYPTDSTACVINETAAKQLGLKDPVGKTLISITGKPDVVYKYKIIGVIRDFHYETLENPIRPLVMLLMPGNIPGYLTVRIAPDDQDSTIRTLKQVWNRYTSAYPFVYYYLDQDRCSYYNPVKVSARIFLLMALITLLMASLSLLALVTFAFTHQQHEIGIQKTMGATNRSIVVQKIKEIAMLVLLASLAAWLGVCFLANTWFKSYAYHTPLNIWYFITATGIVAIFSLATIYYHIWQASRINPVKTLQFE
jgi:putative ABC transport system permease protein